ncbi:MAG: type transport system permease protein [Actinomycetota bacterium]
MIALLVGLSRRNLIELRRYGFDTFFQFAGIFMLFTLIFWGAKGVGGADIREGDTLPAIVVGFVVLSIVLGSFFTTSQWLTQEATLGTLEQIAISPFGLLRVLIAESVASLWFLALMTGAMLIGAEAVSGQWLHLDIVTLTPLIGLLLVQMVGLSLVVGGASVVFKRVASLANLMQFVFLALVSLPIEDYPAVRYMPIGLANQLIRESTVHNVGLFDFNRRDLLQLVLLASAYFAVGVVVFLRCERVARERGLIGVH